MYVRSYIYDRQTHEILGYRNTLQAASKAAKAASRKRPGHEIAYGFAGSDEMTGYWRCAVTEPLKGGE